MAQPLYEQENDLLFEVDSLEDSLGFARENGENHPNDIICKLSIARFKYKIFEKWKTMQKRLTF